jgi:hypothetical protein
MRQGSLVEVSIMNLFILLAAMTMAALFASGARCESAEALQGKAVEHGQLTRQVEELLKRRSWCHRSQAPVGFVLNFFHFEDHEFKIDNKYVSDEGTIIRDAIFVGSWSLSDLADNVVKAHFDVTKASDEDVPPPRDLSLRLVGDDKLEYSNGEKFNLVSDENGLCA